jgi:ribosomal protein S18 acetylase RimI-like enzyme
MPEKLFSGTSRAIGTLEWRLARPEDGPVWVALTREGRSPLVPREALAEPDQWPARDQQEQREELTRFLAGATEQKDMRFMLWRASRLLGRLCFEVGEEQAQLGGLALLPGVEPGVVEQVAQMAVRRAREAGVHSVKAAYEARYAAAFRAAGFQERRRYTILVAATRRVEDGEEVVETIPLSALYRLRSIRDEDAQALSALVREAYRDEPNGGDHSPTIRLTEMAELLEGADNRVLANCSFIAELRRGVHTPARLVGAILVSRWQGAALIDELVVAPRYRRRGIGSVLVRCAMRGLRENNYATVMLILRNDAPALPFYRQLGFREAQPGYVEAEYVLRHEAGLRGLGDENTQTS